MCYMETITHREMRNQSSDVLRRVEAGETLVVSNHGHPVAVIGPVPANTISDLIGRGQARPARKPVSSLAGIRRRTARKSSAEILRDVRGDW